MLLYDARKLTNAVQQLNLGTRLPVGCLHFQHSAARLQAAARQRAAKSAMQLTPGTDQYATPSQVSKLASIELDRLLPQSACAWLVLRLRYA